MPDLNQDCFGGMEEKAPRTLRIPEPVCFKAIDLSEKALEVLATGNMPYRGDLGGKPSDESTLPLRIGIQLRFFWKMFTIVLRL